MDKLEEPIVRLDKWLWAARFFKTRALAAEAVMGGKVHLQGHRVKPSHRVQLGLCLEVQRGFEKFEVVVTGVSTRRGSATDAKELFRETEAGVLRRASDSEKRRLAALQRPHSSTRPDKKQRRKIRHFRETIEGNQTDS